MTKFKSRVSRSLLNGYCIYHYVKANRIEYELFDDKDKLTIFYIDYGFDDVRFKLFRLIYRNY